MRPTIAEIDLEAIRHNYISNDAQEELRRYLHTRSAVRSRSVFVVEKGPCRGKPLSVRGIQKRARMSTFFNHKYASPG